MKYIPPSLPVCQLLILATVERSTPSYGPLLPTYFSVRQLAPPLRPMFS